MSGIEYYQLKLTLLAEADPDYLVTLFQAPPDYHFAASRKVEGANNYFLLVQQVVDSALVGAVPRIIFTSSTSVYSESSGVKREKSPTATSCLVGMSLVELETDCINCPTDRWIFCGWRGGGGGVRQPGRFLAAKQSLPGGGQGVNLVNLADLISAITLLL